MLAYLAVSGLVLTRLRGPVGGLTVTEQRLEGELRFVNSRLITNWLVMHNLLLLVDHISMYRACYALVRR